MKSKMLLGFVILAMIVLVYSCENKSVPLPSPKSLSTCDTTNLTYTSSSNQMKPLIDANCALSGCHVVGGAAPTDYTSYSSMQPYIVGGQKCTFYYYIFVTNKMPLAPQPPLDACTSAKFKAWLMAGAPQ